MYKTNCREILWQHQKEIGNVVFLIHLDDIHWKLHLMKYRVFHDTKKSQQFFCPLTQRTSKTISGVFSHTLFSISIWIFLRFVGAQIINCAAPYVMYLCLSSLAGHVHHNHDLASILLQFHGNTININGLKLVYRPGMWEGHGLM